MAAGQAMNSIWKTVFAALSPAGPRAGLPILIFHRVVARRDELFPGEVTADEFDRICGWLAHWFEVRPLGPAVADLRAGRLGSRALAITFDDGYADNHDIALPILRRHGLTATFFVATGFLDGGRMWNDTVIEAVRLSGKASLDLRGTVADALGELPLGSVPDRRAAMQAVIQSTKYLAPDERARWVDAVARASDAELPADLMMTTAQVRALHDAGMSVGGHTVSHPILSRLDTATSSFEISEGRRVLQDICRAPIELFAYPNGRPGEDYGPEAVELVKQQGFKAAVSTSWGTARSGSDPFQLPRFTPWDRTRHRFALRLARSLLAR
jgi:peptidoglycan/xylan/chitin deacetylase (PgdA/CDA1 family)